MIPIKAGPRQDVPRTGRVEIKIRLCGIWTRSTCYPFPRSDGYTIMAIAPGMGSAGQERKREPGPQRSPCPEPAIPQREGQPEPLRMRLLSEMSVRWCHTVRNTVKPAFEQAWHGLSENLRFWTLGPGQSRPRETNTKAPEASTSRALCWTARSLWRVPIRLSRNGGGRLHAGPPAHAGVPERAGLPGSWRLPPPWIDHSRW